MKTIRLYGDMGKRFGREFKLDVQNPAEAVRALCSQVSGFRAYLHQHAQDAFKVFVGGRNAHESLLDPCGSNEIIRIAPVIEGASAHARIVLGSAILAFSWWNPLGWAANSMMMAATVGMGMSMVMGGVVQLLSPQQTMSSGSGESVENKPNYNFNGAVNTTAQGHPVPLCYGRMIVGSAVISAGIETTQT